MISAITRCFRKVRRPEKSRRRVSPSFKARPLAIECIESRVMLAVTLTPTMPPHVTGANTSPGYIDISGVLNSNTTASSGNSGVSVIDFNAIHNAADPVSSGTLDFNSGGSGQTRIIRIGDGALLSPFSGLIDISSVAGPELPSNQKNTPTVPGESKGSVLAGVGSAPADAPSSALPLGVDGMRGRCQAMEVAQSTCRESDTNGKIDAKANLGVFPIEQAPSKAGLPDKSAAADASAAVSTARTNLSESRLAYSETAKTNRAIEGMDTRAVIRFASTPAAGSSNYSAVADQDARASSEKENSRPSADIEIDHTPSRRENAGETAAPAATSVRREPSEQSQRQVISTEAEKASAESKPLPTAAEETHRSRLVGYAIAAVAGQLAIPGWRRFFFTHKTQGAPPRRRKSAK
jgi:hypothetical protein